MFAAGLVAVLAPLLLIASRGWQPPETEMRSWQPTLRSPKRCRNSRQHSRSSGGREFQTIGPRLDERVTTAMERPGVALQLREGRLVATNRDCRYYAVPAGARNGPNLCILGLIVSDRPHMSTTTRPRGRQEIFFLFSDGVDDVQFELRDGRRISAPVADNAVVLMVKTGVRTASWTDESGTLHRRSLHHDPVDSSD